MGKDANDDTQVVRGRVTRDGDGVAVEIDPIRVDADGHATAVVEFDRPVPIPLSMLIPDPDQRAEFERGVAAVLGCTSDRLDDIVRAGGLDPTRDLAGGDLADSDFGGTADNPVDLRGWDLSGCSLVGCRFDHVIVDGTTNLAGADLTGAVGLMADEVRALSERSRPAP